MLNTKNLKFNNTYDSGSVTLLVVKEGNKYVGVCLEFDLLIQADTQKDAKKQIEDYVRLWHKNAVKNNLPEQILNKPAPKKYWRMYEEMVKQDMSKVKAEKDDSRVPIYPIRNILRFETSYPGLAFA